MKCGDLRGRRNDVLLTHTRRKAGRQRKKKTKEGGMGRGELGSTQRESVCVCLGRRRRGGQPQADERGLTASPSPLKKKQTNTRQGHQNVRRLE